MKHNIFWFLPHSSFSAGMKSSASALRIIHGNKHSVFLCKNSSPLIKSNPSGQRISHLAFIGTLSFSIVMSHDQYSENLGFCSWWRSQLSIKSFKALLDHWNEHLPSELIFSFERTIPYMHGKKRIFSFCSDVILTRKHLTPNSDYSKKWGPKWQEKFSEISLTFCYDHNC